MKSGSICISIVSHGQAALVERLVDIVLRFPSVGRVIVTKNIPEPMLLTEDSRVCLIENDLPAGFGANHNAAFQFFREPFFCPLNPDIGFFESPFPTLLRVFDREPNLALVAPLVISPAGEVEDSIRYFPTLSSLLRKVGGKNLVSYTLYAGAPDFSPDWVAGMFMLFRRSAYETLGGFDEGFFLYYEDVDICVRAWKAGMKIKACPSVSVVHDARRESHRNLQYLRWHLFSMARYFWKHWGKLPSIPAMN